MRPELKAIGDSLLESVKGYVSRAAAALAERIDGIERRFAELPVPKDGRDGAAGKDVDPEFVKAEVARAVAEIPKPKDAEPIDVVALSSQIIDAAAKAVAAIPKPADGKDGKDGRDFDPALLEEAVQKRVDAIPRPADGKDADPEVIRAEVAKAVAEIPRPKDGQDGAAGKDGADGVAGKDGAPGKDADVASIADGVLQKVMSVLDAIPAPKDGSPGADGRDGSDGVPGKDGAPGKDGRDGSDGVPGKDGAPGKDGRDGKDFDPDAVEEAIKRYVAAIPRAADGKDGKDGSDGKSVDPDDVAVMVRREVSSAVSALPPVEVDQKDIEAAVAKAVAEIPKPKDGAPGTDGKDGSAGNDADPEKTAALVLSEVQKAVALIPKAQDGKSVSIDDVRSLLEGEVAKWALEFERRSQDVLQRAIDKLEPPKDGKDGLDGFAPDDFDVELKDGETLVFTLKSGQVERVKEIHLPIPRDKGTYKSGGEYREGAGVTYAGCLWIAKRDTNESPGGQSRDWRLAVKCGRDGKDGKDAPQTIPED